MHNFEGARALMLEYHAGVQVADGAALAAEVAALLGDGAYRGAMGAAGRRAVEGNRGALARLLAVLDTAVPPAG